MEIFYIDLLLKLHRLFEKTENKWKRGPFLNSKFYFTCEVEITYTYVPTSMTHAPQPKLSPSNETSTLTKARYVQQLPLTVALSMNQLPQPMQHTSLTMCQTHETCMYT